MTSYQILVGGDFSYIRNLFLEKLCKSWGKKGGCSDSCDWAHQRQEPGNGGVGAPDGRINDAILRPPIVVEVEEGLHILVNQSRFI